MVSVARDDSRDRIQATLRWIADTGIDGFGILPPAQQVATEQLRKSADREAAIDAVIRWRTTYAAGTGFGTGLGGVAALPISLPAGLATSYALGANAAGAIAHLRGYDVYSEPVRTTVLLCLLGEAGEEILKSAAISAGSQVYRQMIKQLPGRVLAEINQTLGFRLVTKAGEEGAVSLMKSVPLVGGIVGGTFDSISVHTCGQTAKNVFT